MNKVKWQWNAINFGKFTYGFKHEKNILGRDELCEKYAKKL